jgi:hypothetical protein
MLGYVDLFLGGDEKQPDLPPRLMQRLQTSVLFGGDGSSTLLPYFQHLCHSFQQTTLQKHAQNTKLVPSLPS